MSIAACWDPTGWNPAGRECGIPIVRHPEWQRCNLPHDSSQILAPLKCHADSIAVTNKQLTRWSGPSRLEEVLSMANLSSGTPCQCVETRLQLYANGELVGGLDVVKVCTHQPMSFCRSSKRRVSWRMPSSKALNCMLCGPFFDLSYAPVPQEY